VGKYVDIFLNSGFLNMIFMSAKRPKLTKMFRVGHKLEELKRQQRNQRADHRDNEENEYHRF
jgi:hypothetical protein